jgi:pilus assembly protein Flp/PilA
VLCSNEELFRNHSSSAGQPAARFGSAFLKKFAMGLIKRFLKDENAATAIEYGLIATGIAVAIIPVLTGLGTKLKTTFSSISTALK